jgi:hypothetical protein
MEDLYGNPNKPVPVQRNQAARVPVNQKKVLYQVYFEPYIYEKEVRRMGLKFTPDKKYPVHAVIPDPSGRLDAQKIAVTDDVGRIIEVDEKYFSSVGAGLLADGDHRFSGSSARNIRRPKLAFENEMFMESPDPNMGAAIPQGIPVDNGEIPDHLLSMPDIRPNKRA